MPSRPEMTPPVGKSGPWMMPQMSSTEMLGRSMMVMVASMISSRLCGGMLVVMPTAMPVDPFISRFGRAEGRTVGSVVDSL